MISNWMRNALGTPSPRRPLSGPPVERQRSTCQAAAAAMGPSTTAAHYLFWIVYSMSNFKNCEPLQRYTNILILLNFVLFNILQASVHGGTMNLCARATFLMTTTLISVVWDLRSYINIVFTCHISNVMSISIQNVIATGGPQRYTNILFKITTAIPRPPPRWNHKIWQRIQWPIHLEVRSSSSSSSSLSSSFGIKLFAFSSIGLKNRCHHHSVVIDDLLLVHSLFFFFCISYSLFFLLLLLVH